MKDQRFRVARSSSLSIDCAHEVDSATRWGRHLAAVADSIFAQFGSGPRRSLRRSAERPARAAWAALRLLADSFSRIQFGANDGARAFGGDADDDGVVAAAPASYGVIANRRH